jgi:tRNA A-37 threonylcarbamoyl transferase component Bud32
MKQIYSCLRALHKNSITHGNLTLHNIFVDPETLHVKVNDYAANLLHIYA